MKEAVGSAKSSLPRVSACRAEDAASGPVYPPYFADLYARSAGQKFGLSFSDFVAILQEISARYLAPGAAQAEVAELHQSLRVEELVLARACAGGCEAAWESFLNQYRQKLYEAAGSIARDESVARELADSLYADLFGTRKTDGGCRISKLASYTGRGSLEGWLRTVLAQEYVNRYRIERRLVSFDEQIRTAPLTQLADTAASPSDARLEPAVEAALLELTSEERYLLASWFLDERTLAEIARMLGVHESTISRRIGKITAALRKRIVRGLRDHGMSARAAEEALDAADVRDLTLDVRKRLVQEKSL
jgi:RNA polymerase sigma-70 factor (ECF subfamily)